jgi:hypothetical protein
MVDATTVMGQDHPYDPSWVDRFTQWVQQLPLRAWLFYGGFALVLVAIQVLFLWLADGFGDVELLPVIIFNGLFTPFLLALVHFLDNQAVIALNSVRPALDATESEFEKFQFMLSNMPSRAMMIAGLTALVMVILMEQLWIEPIRYAALERLPIFTIVFQIVDKSSAFLFGVLIYHTIRQLRLVNTINMNHIRVNLFNLRPLQAFSRLTAATAVGLVVGVYGWVLINPELLTDPVILGFAGLISITALAVFVWPLYGVHRLMVTEKEKLLRALDQDFEAVFARFNQGLREDDYAAIERLNGTITSLEIQYKRIAAIPTWPWRSETAQFALTAIALPLVLAILRFLVERAFNL